MLYDVIIGFPGQATSQYVCPLGHQSWEGVEILHAFQYDTEQINDFIFAMTVNGCQPE